MGKKRREGVLEARCVKLARLHGVLVAKLTELDGVPDRIFFFPSGRPWIIEFKARDEEPVELQAWYLNELQTIGYNVAWCDTYEEFEKLCMAILSKYQQ
jgi:hypothetical protein